MTPPNPLPHEAQPVWRLIVEPSPRWAASLRAALARRGRPAALALVRSVDEPPPLDALLATRSPVLLGLVLASGRLGDQLSSLAALQSLPMVCPVGLINRTEFGSAAPSVAAAAVEAGAAIAIQSPRDAEQLVPLGDRHARRSWRRLAEQLPPHELLRRRLPWQSEPWAIR